jgi:hypothetical protein
MLNIGKLAPGGEGYYLQTVATGVEDYYTGAGEAPGYWLGGPQLGLAGRVEPEGLRAVLGATVPATGEPLRGVDGVRDDHEARALQDANVVDLAGGRHEP